MQVPRSILEQVYDEITTSVGYLTTVGPIDRGKVTRRRAGEVTRLPSSKLGRAAWRVAALLSPVVPQPPPPAYKKVAPRVAYKQGSSDARYCVRDLPVMNDPEHPWHGRRYDEVASYDNDGLCWGGRSDGPALTGALEINGREYCDLPTFGDPTKNTGSWAI